MIGEARANRRALRARRVPVRDRPRRGVGAHQQRRLRGREANCLHAMERRLSPARRMDWAYFHHLRANLEQRLGHFGNAAKAAEQAVDLARETGLPSVQVPHFLARLAHSRISRGRSRRRHARHGRRDRHGVRGRSQDVRAAARARVRSTRTSPPAKRSARSNASPPCSPTTGRAGQVMFLRNRPDLAARLANFALAHGIETEFVRDADRAQRARSRPPTPRPAWPFRLRIRALGGFELIRDGQPMRFTGKAAAAPARSPEAAGGARRQRRRHASS